MQRIAIVIVAVAVGVAACSPSTEDCVCDRFGGVYTSDAATVLCRDMRLPISRQAPLWADCEAAGNDPRRAALATAERVRSEQEAANAALQAQQRQFARESERLQVDLSTIGMPQEQIAAKVRSLSPDDRAKLCGLGATSLAAACREAQETP